MRLKKKAILTAIKRHAYECDAATIACYRRNPVIACRDLLGIQLFDAQKYMLEQSWNASHVLWACSRNFGKSFVGSILIILKAILYENQAIYIVSSVGDQSKVVASHIQKCVCAPWLIAGNW